MSLSHRTFTFAVLFACACIAFTQQTHETQQRPTTKAVWKEYSYPPYGFAVTVPKVPTETAIQNGTQFRLYWDENADVVVNLRAKQSPTDCSAWVSALVKTGITMVTIGGKPALEANGPRNSLQNGYERQQCLNGRLYIFEAGWPKDQHKPPVVGRVVNSFRLLKK